MLVRLITVWSVSLCQSVLSQSEVSHYANPSYHSRKCLIMPIRLITVGNVSLLSWSEVSHYGQYVFSQLMCLIVASTSHHSLKCLITATICVLIVVSLYVLLLPYAYNDNRTIGSSTKNALTFPRVKQVIFSWCEQTSNVVKQALMEVDALRIGNKDYCKWETKGIREHGREKERER